MGRHGPRGGAGDPMVADYLVHAGERSHNLEELSRRYLGHQVIPITDLIGKKARGQVQLSMDQVPTARVAEYSGEDADVAWQLRGKLAPLLTEKHQEKVFFEIECPLLPVLVAMESEGVTLDTGALADFSQKLARGILSLEQRI